MKQDIQMEGAKGAVAVGGAVWYSLTLNEWVAFFTLVYIALQIGLLLVKYYDIYKNRSKRKKTEKAKKKNEPSK